MATPLDRKQLVSFEGLLMSQAVGQDGLTGLLVEKWILTLEEFMEMAKVADAETIGKRIS